MEKPKVLIVGPVSEKQKAVAGILQAEGLAPVEADSMATAIRCLLDSDFDVAVLMLGGPEECDWFARHATRLRPWLQCVVVGVESVTSPGSRHPCEAGRIGLPVTAQALSGAMAEAFRRTREARRHVEQIALGRTLDRFGVVCRGIHLASDGGELPNLLDCLLATFKEVVPCLAGGVLDLTQRVPRFALQSCVTNGAESLVNAMRASLIVAYEAIVGRKMDESLSPSTSMGACSDGQGDCPVADFFHIPIVNEEELVALLTLVLDAEAAPPPQDLAFLGHVANHIFECFTPIARVFRMAHRDGLTGLHNRSWFDQELNRIWSLSERYGRPCAMIFMDVDGLKVINDTYGHPTGDAILTGLALLLCAGARATDLLARYGGDEFVIILPVCSAEQARICADRLLDSILTHPIQRSGHPLQISVSMGVAASTSPGVHHASDLLKMADHACYLAKERGKSQVCSAEQLSADGQPPQVPDESLPVSEPTQDVLSGRVFMVDDEPAICAVMEAALVGNGFKVWTETNPVVALQRIRQMASELDVVVTDLRMPEIDGLRMIEEVRKISPQIVPILMTGYASTESAVAALRAGSYDYIRKPVNIGELVFTLNRAVERRRLRQQIDDYRAHLERALDQSSKSLDAALRNLQGSYMATMEALSSILQKRELTTAMHDRRVAEYAAMLAREMGLDEETIVVIRRGALLHDFGKIGIPDGILNKPDSLTADEWVVMKRHPTIGYEILSTIPFLHDEAEMVYAHHERYDGQGYPRGLKGSEISIGARIFAVADAYDAMRSDRPYRKALDHDKVIQEIVAGAGSQFDPDVVAAFMQCRGDLERAALLFE